MQLLLFSFCIYFICRGSLYAYACAMWLEDVLLEIPMVAISFHLTQQTDLPLSTIIVVAGGLLSVAVAIGETIMQFRGVNASCVKCCYWIASSISECCSCICECLVQCCVGCGTCITSCPERCLPAYDSDCANCQGVWLGVLCDYLIMAEQWIIVQFWDGKNPGHIVLSGIYTCIFGPGFLVMCCYMADPKRNKCFIAIFATISTIVAIVTAIYCTTEEPLSVFPPAPFLAWPLAILKIWTYVMFLWKARG